MAPPPRVAVALGALDAMHSCKAGSSAMGWREGSWAVFGSLVTHLPSRIQVPGRTKHSLPSVKISRERTCTMELIDCRVDSTDTSSRR